MITHTYGFLIFAILIAASLAALALIPGAKEDARMKAEVEALDWKIEELGKPLSIVLVGIVDGEVFSTEHYLPEYDLWSHSTSKGWQISKRTSQDKAIEFVNDCFLKQRVKLVKDGDIIYIPLQNIESFQIKKIIENC